MMMMEGRPLKRPYAEDGAVKAARSRFKNVLKHMVQDNFLHDESDEDDDPNSALNSLGGQTLGRFGAFPSSRSSLNASPSKKLMRRTLGSDDDDQPPPSSAKASFVMKLFDRGVDLAQFDEATPLYPICRAWMHNKPHTRQPRREEEEETLEEEDEGEEVGRLPPPEPLPVDEYGHQIRVRVPPALPRQDEAFDINYEEADAPSPALLFQTHLDRWTLIRQRWREASAYNDRRYESSFTILRHIHDRVSNIQITPAQIHSANAGSNTTQQQQVQQNEN